MKYVCEKCGRQFNDVGECMKHERICGLAEDDICDMMRLRIFFGNNVKASSENLTMSRVEAYRDYTFGRPTAECSDISTIFVEAKDEANGWRILCDHALAKLAEKRKVINRNIRLITAIKEAKK